MKTSILLKTSAVLWVVWGLVHAFSGIMTISSDTTSAVQSIANGVNVELLAINYPDALGGIIKQRGWNLLWFGVTTTVGAIFIWRNSATAIFVTAMIGGLADLGYFIFLDLAGYVNFLPGTIMTIISALAIVLSFAAHFSSKQKAN